MNIPKQHVEPKVSHVQPSLQPDHLALNTLQIKHRWLALKIELSVKRNLELSALPDLLEHPLVLMIRPGVVLCFLTPGMNSTPSCQTLYAVLQSVFQEEAEGKIMKIKNKNCRQLCFIW